MRENTSSETCGLAMRLCNKILALQGIILSRLKSVKEVEYAPREVYIFLQVKAHGPLLYHVYLWVGIKVHGSVLEEAFKHVQNLAHCLPGKPVIHKEVSETSSVVQSVNYSVYYSVYSICKLLCILTLYTQSVYYSVN